MSRTSQVLSQTVNENVSNRIDGPITPENELERLDLSKGTFELSKGGKIIARFAEEKGFLSPLFDAFNYFYDQGLEKIMRTTNIRFYVNVYNRYSNQYIAHQRMMGKSIKTSIQGGYENEFVRVGEVTISFANGRIHRPVVSDYKSRSVTSSGMKINNPGEDLLLPIVARDANLTYSGKVTASIVATLDTGEEIDRTNNHQHIHNIPVMVGSKACNTYGLEGKDRVNKGECFTDPGGYFIIKGSEKVVLIQENLAKNERFLVMQKVNTKVDSEDGDGGQKDTEKEYPGVAITCDSSRGTSKFMVLLVEQKLKDKVKADIVTFNTSTLKMNANHPLNIFLAIREMYGFYERHFIAQGYDVATIHQIFNISIQSIFNSLISMMKQDQAYRDKLTNFLKQTSIMVKKLLSETDIEQKDDLRRKHFLRSIGYTDVEKVSIEEYNKILKKVVEDEIFYEIKIDPYNVKEARIALDKKMNQLYLSIIKLLEYACGYRDFDDRDHYGVKIDKTAGEMISDLERSFLTTFARKKQSELAPGPSRGPSASVIYLYETPNQPPKIVYEGFELSAFIPPEKDKDMIEACFSPGRWGISVAKTKNITEILMSDSILYRYSHLMRISTPSKTSGQQINARLARMSQVRFVCLSETPEGSNCGLVKNPTIGTLFSLRRDEELFYDLVTSRETHVSVPEHLLIELNNQLTSLICNTDYKIFINKNRVGYSNLNQMMNIWSSLPQQLRGSLDLDLKCEKFAELFVAQMILNPAPIYDSVPGAQYQLAVNGTVIGYIDKERIEKLLKRLPQGVQPALGETYLNLLGDQQLIVQLLTPKPIVTGSQFNSGIPVRFENQKSGWIYQEIALQFVKLFNTNCRNVFEKLVFSLEELTALQVDQRLLIQEISQFVQQEFTYLTHVEIIIGDTSYGFMPRQSADNFARAYQKVCSYRDQVFALSFFGGPINELLIASLSQHISEYSDHFAFSVNGIQMRWLNYKDTTLITELFNGQPASIDDIDVNDGSIKHEANLSINIQNLETDEPYRPHWLFINGEKKGLVTVNTVTLIASQFLDSYHTETYISNEINHDYPHKFVLNGRLMGFCNSSIVAQRARQVRRFNKDFFDVSIVVDEIDSSLYINTGSCRIISPLLIVEDNELMIEKKNMWNAKFEELLVSGCLEYVDAAEHETLDICYSIEKFEEIQAKKRDLRIEIKMLSKGRIDDFWDRRSRNGRDADRITDDPDYLMNDLIEKYKRLRRVYTHCDVHPCTQGGLSVNIIPLFNHNQSPRNTFQCQMGKQSKMIPNSLQMIRFDTTKKVLTSPSSALFEPQTNRMLRMDKMPAGHNMTVAILDYYGWDSEDSFVLNKDAVDRGLMRYIVYRTYKTVCATTSVYKETFARPIESSEMKFKDRYMYIDDQGMPYIGVKLKAGQCVIGKIRTYHKNKDEGEKTENASILIPESEEGMVVRVIKTEKNGEQICKVLVAQYRIPRIGDKFASRHAQKGSIALLEDSVNLPFDPFTGEVPMLLLTSHQIPSRMTTSKLIELIAGKATLLSGEYFDATAFSSVPRKRMEEILRSYGYSETGKHRLVDGMTGEVLNCAVYMGPIYYQNLKHDVLDKMQSGVDGPINMVTRQPVGGRNRGGALRFGEMERDAVIGYGASEFGQERLMKVSDAYKYLYCKSCGTLIHSRVGTGEFKCTTCNGTDIGKVTIPHPYKLFTQNLALVGHKFRFRFNDKKREGLD